MSYTRQVPKFLQAHAHLLGKGHARQEEEPTLTAEEVKQDAGTDSEDEQVTALLLDGISKCTTKQGLATIHNEGPALASFWLTCADALARLPSRGLWRRTLS